MKKMDKKTKNAIFIVLNLILAVLTMSLALFTITRMLENNSNDVSTFIGFALISEALHQAILFLIYSKMRDKLRIIVVGSTYVLAAVFGFISRNNYIFFYFSTLLVILAMILNQALTISKEKTKRGIVTSILISITLILLGLMVILSFKEADSIYIPLVSALLLLFSSLKKLLLPSLRYEKVKLLLNILIKTHTFDVLICLLSFIIAFSFMFPMVETNIPTFWDAMWYCFTVVTTIGFGDFYAVSLVGRILTVILGIYGIVVVAILTSVIVNFYNEVSKDKNNAEDYLE